MQVLPSEGSGVLAYAALALYSLWAWWYLGRTPADWGRRKSPVEPWEPPDPEEELQTLIDHARGNMLTNART